MKKTTLSAVSAVMAAVIAFGGAAPQAAVFAETAAVASSAARASSSAKMEEALKTVKSRINIPEEYSDFSYSTKTEKTSTGYNFTWKAANSVGELKGAINVTIMDGVITRYSVNDYLESYENKPTLAALSKEKLREYAASAIKLLNPDIAEEIETAESFSISLRSNEVYIPLKRKVNGLYFGKNTGYVYIDKNTGEVISLYLSWWNDAEFEDSSKAVNEDKMEKSFKDNVTLKPSYVISSEYNEKTSSYDKTARLILSPSEKAVFDAVTAAPTTMYDDYAKANNTANYSLYDTVDDVVEEEAIEEAVTADATAAAEDGGGAEVSLSSAEKQALMESGKYYSQTDAVALLVKDKYLKLTDDYVMEGGYFSEDSSSPSGYSWQFSFYKNTEDEYRSIYVTMDAESGKVLSFDKYAKSPTKIINIRTVNKIAEQAAEYYLSDIFSEYKSSDSNSADANKETARTMVFDRYVNDIPVTGNNIRVRVNSDGEVMNFSYNYDDVKFPSAEMINEDTAYEKAFAQTDFNLYYDGFLTLDGKAQVYMLYSIDDFFLDAKTGQLCTSTGAPIIGGSSETKDCPYTDISGHWAEKYITAMYDYGIKLSADSDGKFNPDKPITEREFSELLNSIFYVNVMPLMYDGYTYSTRGNYGNEPMTKATAAKEIVLSAEGKEFAEIKGIYKSPFKDVSADREDLGYIALAYGMGAVKADSNGNFNPDSKLTRGYAMYMLYSYLKNGS